MLTNLDSKTNIGNSSAKLEQAMPVSRLVNLLKSEVEDRHRSVRVLGELSSFKIWRSGHSYFDIKDDSALLPAVMFRPHVQKMKFKASDGMQCIFAGRISIYAASSRLQMVVESIDPLGQGALYAAFEQLKASLKSEGLFDERYKKPIKQVNNTIGIITSSHGAVLRDMVRIIKSRMPMVNVLFYSARVQGVGAAKEIAQGVELLDKTNACDVIIVGRGGGSLEDLWAFNEEILARAIFSCSTPIVSAVGHETDTTISDFISDIRAATPTHAASIVTPIYTELEKNLQSNLKDLYNSHSALIKHYHLLLKKEAERINDPRILLFKHWQYLDDLSKKLYEQSPLLKLKQKNAVLYEAKTKLLSVSPQKLVEREKAQLLEIKKDLVYLLKRHLAKKSEELKVIIASLHGASPLKVLSRGFSMVTSENGDVVRGEELYVGQAVDVHMKDTTLKTKIIDINRRSNDRQ